MKQFTLQLIEWYAMNGTQTQFCIWCNVQCNEGKCQSIIFAVDAHADFVAKSKPPKTIPPP